MKLHDDGAQDKCDCKESAKRKKNKCRLPANCDFMAMPFRKILMYSCHDMHSMRIKFWDQLKNKCEIKKVSLETKVRLSCLPPNLSLGDKFKPRKSKDTQMGKARRNSSYLCWGWSRGGSPSWGHCQCHLAAKWPVVWCQSSTKRKWVPFLTIMLAGVQVLVYLHLYFWLVCGVIVF